MRWQKRPATLALSVVALLLLMALATLVAGCSSSTTPAAPVSHANQTATAATPTVQDQLNLLVRQAIGGAIPVQSSYDAQKQAIQIEITLDKAVADTPDGISAAQEQVKTLCWQAQKALWGSDVSLQTVTVIVQGPVLDQYADMTTQAYGVATMTAAKAATLTWSSLTADSAWAQYDNSWLREDYNDTI